MTQHQEYLDDIEDLKIKAGRFSKGLTWLIGSWVVCLATLVLSVVMGVLSVGSGIDWGGIVAFAIMCDILPLAALPFGTYQWIKMHTQKSKGSLSYEWTFGDWPSDKVRKAEQKYNRWLANQANL